MLRVAARGVSTLPPELHCGVDASGRRVPLHPRRQRVDMNPSPCLPTQEASAHPRSACLPKKLLPTQEASAHPRSVCPPKKLLSNQEASAHPRSFCPPKKRLPTQEASALLPPLGHHSAPECKHGAGGRRTTTASVVVCCNNGVGSRPSSNHTRRLPMSAAY